MNNSRNIVNIISENYKHVIFAYVRGEGNVTSEIPGFGEAIDNLVKDISSFKKENDNHYTASEEEAREAISRIKQEVWNAEKASEDEERELLAPPAAGEAYIIDVHSFRIPAADEQKIYTLSVHDNVQVVKNVSGDFKIYINDEKVASLCRRCDIDYNVDSDYYKDALSYDLQKKGYGKPLADEIADEIVDAWWIGYEATARVEGKEVSACSYSIATAVDEIARPDGSGLANVLDKLCEEAGLDYENDGWLEAMKRIEGGPDGKYNLLKALDNNVKIVDLSNPLHINLD